MELWNYIQILGQERQGWWLARKDNLENRLIALDQILEKGTLYSIQHLIPYLKDPNSDIRNRTYHVITQLFENITSKKEYYNALKHCDISKSDIDYYQQTFSNEECVVLYSIASLNSKGFVREKAVKYLTDSKNEKAIPFIIYRLADWVEQVRKVALQGIENYKKNEFVNGLVKNLPLFEWIKSVQRADLSAVHSEIMDFVLVEHGDYLNEYFASFSDDVRITIAKKMVIVTEIEVDKLSILLNDKNFIVRSIALCHFDKLTQHQIDCLLIDKSPQVRLKTLHRLKDHPNFVEIVYPFLMDRSRSIRELARYSLKHSVDDFARIYNDKLLNNESVISSLYGLAETDGKKFVNSIIPFLDSPKAKVKKAAFLALSGLDESRAYDYALSNLDSEHAGIRKLVVAFLSNYKTTDVLQKAREVYKYGNDDLKKSILLLFSNIGKWQVIADIMLGTVDENANIRQISMVYLRQWINKAPSYFVMPQQEDLERANTVFEFAFKIHEQKKYFEKNPLSGIDFYLR
ncbi:HEAT repeat domain-containing protein [Sphingobacterium yanglingense]|uniref:HEAT repeat protein n=1 Tax=Sphingobacterium yanglingense TaxID=1437280 RepID=A0A4R6WJX3_9SPHI|nr:hypothetical protein [Sphingobacterium yanglingense]TDQ79058.1 HEAT repeat protein [Sphingobacterium yanglingense]